jgi:hypothetical protein
LPFSFFLAHLVLIEGQALYVLSDLIENSEPVYYANNVITYKSFTLANLVLTISVFIFFLIYYATPRRKGFENFKKLSKLQETFFSYTVVAAIVLIACGLLIRLLGGIKSFYYSLGRMVGGQVMFMILISIGKLPLFNKIVLNRKPSYIDWSLFLISTLMIMLNSRGMALLIILQYFVLGYYSGINNQNIFKTILKAGIISFFIIIVYGGVRDYVTPVQTFEGLMEYYFRNDSMKIFEMKDLFFRFMIGTFTGLAGILNTYITSGINYDFGIMNLHLLTHLVPYKIRMSVLYDIEKWLAEFSVSGSVVPGGYESSFIHLGFVGIFIFSIAIGVLPKLLHNQLLSIKSDRLKYGILAVYILVMLMVALWNVLFWILAELSILFLYRLILSVGIGIGRKQNTLKFGAIT